MREEINKFKVIPSMKKKLIVGLFVFHDRGIYYGYWVKCVECATTHTTRDASQKHLKEQQCSCVCSLLLV